MKLRRRHLSNTDGRHYQLVFIRNSHETMKQTGIPIATVEHVKNLFNTIKKNIYLKQLRAANCRRRSWSTCRDARATWPKYDIKKTTAILSMTRSDCHRNIPVETCPIGVHVERLGIPFNSICRNCNQRFIISYM